jgi:hypothetical protein
MVVVDMALTVLVSIVILFIGLFMISRISELIGNLLGVTNKFYGTFTNLVANSGMLFDFMVLVILIVVVGASILILKGTSGRSLLGD